jgi:preprotein translocase subunit Sec63
MARWLILIAAAWLLWRYLKPLLGLPAASSRPSGHRDPHTVLGLPRGAAPDEITRAYREQIKLYHPDRVADLGEDLRRVAHEKTLEIQRAYEALTRSS